MQTNSYGNNLRILRGIKFKKFLDHDFATAQPLSKSGGDQVNCTIDSLAMLTEIQMKVSLSQLRKCADGHLGCIQQQCDKAELLNSMAKHACEVSCPSMSIIVHLLKHAWKPLIDQDNETKAPLSAKSKGKCCTVDMDLM